MQEEQQVQEQELRGNSSGKGRRGSTTVNARSARRKSAPLSAKQPDRQKNEQILNLEQTNRRL